MKKFFTGLKQKFLSKLLKLNTTSYAIAAGFASGVAVSMTPFIGFHTLLAALTALLLRASIPAAILGTLVGNPWTFILIWPLTYETGRLILKKPHIENIDFETVFENLKSALFTENWHTALSDAEEIILPMAVGSVVFYIATFALSYIAIRHLLKNLGKKD